MLRELNEVVDYIERHLTEELPPEELARYAGITTPQLQAVFYVLAGQTLAEYIKNRRLSAAAQELQRGGRVTDVAYRYTYQSVDGFTRAFRRWCGALPSEITADTPIKTIPKIQFVITIKGGTSMEYKIVEKPAFHFAGVSRRVPMQFEGVNQEIVKLAQSITPEQREELHRLRDTEPKEIINASYQSDTNFLREEGELTHLIGVLTSREDVGAGLEKLPIPAHTWAVFPNQGPFPATMQDTMARIYSEWLPSSGYQLADSLSFSFTRMDTEQEGHAYSEIWIPVTPAR